MKRFLVFSLMATFVAWRAAAQDFPLVPAPSLTTEGDVLVTVALDEATLEAGYAERFADRHDAGMLAVWPLRSIDLVCIVLEAVGEDGAALRARLLGDAAVVTAEPIRRYAVSEGRYEDDLVAIQDALHGMNVLAAHGHSTGAGVRVAVIDTGVATDHPDLADQEITYADFVRTAPQGVVAERHGTAMAGLIAGDASNGHGIVGVAPDVTMLALRACWEDGDDGGRCNSFTLARALNVALLQEADVINLSLGGPADPLLARLVEAALADGRIVVGADEGAAFPAALPGVIGAGRGDGAIAAPDTDVISTAPGGAYDFFSGASVATANVSGVVALMRANEAGLAHEDARRRLADARREGALDACAALVGETATCR